MWVTHGRHGRHLLLLHIWCSMMHAIRVVIMRVVAVVGVMGITERGRHVRDPRSRTNHV